MEFQYLIIGGGLAAANAMQELVRLQPEASIGVAGEEKERPYDRPPLSKEFLLGKMDRQSVFLLPDDFFEAHSIELMLGQRAVAVDPAAHEVETGDGSRLRYGKLLIASGCRLRRLSVPGADLPGLYYLRTLAESEALKRAAARARQAVIIGAGFIGLETASVLADRGLDVTIIHQGDRLFEKFASGAISDYFEELYAARGVHTAYNDQAVALSGEGRVQAVSTQGGRTLPCDLAVAGIGVYPDTAYLQSSGLELDNGVLVDEYLRASDPDVYAAGDAANFFDPVYGRRRRTEHWDNAIKQGTLAARNMAGAREINHRTSYFYSTVFGLTFDFFGDPGEHDEQIMRGSLEDRSAAVFYLKAGILQAAFMWGRPYAESQAVQRLISEQRHLDGVQDRLADESFALEKALAA